LGHARARCCREIDAGKQKPYRKRMAAAVARSGRDQRRQCASERVGIREVLTAREVLTE